ncbi:MAG: hypothetical protein WCH83_01835 [Alphaproteobacteria bacterium]|jgi:hypothetical protein
MNNDGIEYRVAALLGSEAFDEASEWERFRDLSEARRYIALLGRLGLGAVIYSVTMNAGVADMSTLTEVMRQEVPLEAQIDDIAA